MFSKFSLNKWEEVNPRLGCFSLNGTAIERLESLVGIENGSVRLLLQAVAKQEIGTETSNFDRFRTRCLSRARLVSQSQCSDWDAAHGSEEAFDLFEIVSCIFPPAEENLDFGSKVEPASDQAIGTEVLCEFDRLRGVELCIFRRTPDEMQSRDPQYRLSELLSPN
jgi:hypothetical protein